MSRALIPVIFGNVAPTVWVDYTLRGNETFILPETGWVEDASSGSPDYCANPPFNDVSFRFRGTLSGLKVYGYRKGNVVLLTVDGVDHGITTFPTTSNWGWVTLATDLDWRREHEYVISSVRTNTGSYPFWVQLSALGKISQTALAARSRYSFYGDSITHAAVVAGLHSNSGYAHLIGLSRGVLVDNRGVSGASVVPNGRDNTAYITALSPATAQCVVLFGTNDLDAIVGGSLTLADFQTAYTTMLTSLATGLPNCHFYVLGLLPRTDKTAEQTAPVSGAIAAAVTAVGDSDITYTDAYTWINKATDLADIKHPNAAGYAKIAAQLLALIPA